MKHLMDFKIFEGKTMKAVNQNDSDVKKDLFRDKVESHLKSMKFKYKRVGDDFEANCELEKDGKSVQIMFRDDKISLKSKGNKTANDFKYNELGKLKSEINKLLK